MQEALFNEKRTIIENCLFGVDINPNSVNICRLRLWIELLKNSYYTKESGYTRLETLPNIDINIKVGDSLLHRYDISDTVLNRNIKEYKSLVRNYKCTRSKEDKNRIEESIGKFKKELSEEIQEWMPVKREYRKAERVYYSFKERGLFDDTRSQKERQGDLRRLATAEKAFEKARKSLEEATSNTIYKNGFEWRIEFPEALDNDGAFKGFDIIIGNPPYIQLQTNGGLLAKKYERCKFVSFTRTGDIYCLFYEQGWRLLKDGGILCFISSNKWMRAGYGKSLRQFLADNTNPELLLDFGGIQVFDNATVGTNILLFSKEENKMNTMAVSASRQQKDILNNLSDFVRHNAAESAFTGSDSWVILSPVEQSIKRKIEAVGVPLKDWDIQINYGIKTGYNEAFIITTEKRDEILSNCADEDERQRTDALIRPILRGRDIKRYGYEWAGLWLINAHNGIKGRLERVHIEDYPSVKAWLDKGGLAYNGKHYYGYHQIAKRTDQGDTPYNLRNCAYLDDFNKTQIVWLELTDLPKFSLVKDMVSLNTVFFMTGEHLNHIIGFLNSTVLTWYFHNCLGARSGAGTNRWLKYTIEQLPIPPICERIADIIGDSNITTKSESEEINEACMDIFTLNEEEKAVIRSFVIK